MRAVMFLALLSVGLSMEVTVQSSLRFDESLNGSPVAKVVAVLKDMIKEMEKEAELDEEAYNKQACWCDSNDKEKTKSIADAETRIYDLTSKIEELIALSAQLNTEIKNLGQEVAKNQNALDEATALRQKELAEFVAEEKDLLGSIGAIKSAITVMKKHNSAASFMQVEASQKQIVAAKLNHVMKTHSDMLKHELTHSQKKAINAFIQSPEDGMSSKGPSSEIFGLMTQMKETFETNLATAQKEEASALSKYEELKAAKEDEIKDGETMSEQKTQELATTDEKHAQAVEDLADTKTTLASDEEFLADLKEQCAMQDAEFEERTKTRQLEMEASSKALALLNSDEAHALFSKTFAFVQVASESQSTTQLMAKRRMEASKVLAAVARKYGNPRFSAIAYQAKLDSFTKVKKAIDDMIAALIEEKKAEIKQKDFCVEEFNTNGVAIERKEREKSDTEATIADLQSTIEALTSAIDTLGSEVDDLKTNLIHAGQDREAANSEFATTVADAKATQALLKKALEMLEGFYKKAAASLLQVSTEAVQKVWQTRGAVMEMMEDIIKDAKKMEAEAIRAEEKSQEEYETFVKESNNGIETKTKDSTNKAEEKAKTEAALVEAQKTDENLALELEQLANYKLGLHKECDFVMKNFEVRQSSRDEEVEALKQAKSILSGAKFEAMLQSASQ